MPELVRPGHFWCGTCMGWIPDVFTDHENQHLNMTVDKLNGDVIAFWAACVSLGVMAAFVVDVIADRM